MHYSALRAAFGGCALYRPAGLVARERPRLPLMRELAPQATEGEKCSILSICCGKRNIFSLPQSASLTAPSSEGAFGCGANLKDKLKFAQQLLSSEVNG